MNKHDITIIGAGPAGATAAITLAKQGISCLLIDKHGFPREKICGDGLSGKAVSILNRMDPAVIQEILSRKLATASHAARFFSPGMKRMELAFRPAGSDLPSGLIFRRASFDEFLVEKAKESARVTLMEQAVATLFERKPASWVIKDKSGNILSETKLILLATGYDRGLIGQLDPGCNTGAEVDGIGVRGYFEQVSGFDDFCAIELHFIRELLPWYLWIFPFDDGSANVGLALPETMARRNKESLKSMLLRLLATHPQLKERFSNARIQGKIEAARLPFFNRRSKVSGPGFMLLGDAARLIDPFTGEGIGNAMASGTYAAEIAAKSAQTGDFSPEMLKGYDSLIASRLYPELETGLRMQKLARHPHLLNFVIGRAAANDAARNAITEMLYNAKAKNKLKNPAFYLKLLLSR